MITPTRRTFLAGASAAVLAGCDAAPRFTDADVIDRRIDSALDYMFDTYPSTIPMGDRAAGLLVMPLMGEAGFGVGGAYGEGGLVIRGVTVDQYSATQASVGFQIGAQTFAYTLFFNTPNALQRFRASPGWEAGAIAEWTAWREAEAFSASTVARHDVVAFLFAQQGLIAGATVEGTKFTRLPPRPV